MRRFHFHRVEDESGVSGVGIIAEGVVFTDGTVALRWITKFKSTAIYNNMDECEKIHGHNGKTKIIWKDE